MGSWAACLSLPPGVFLACHKIMTVTTPSSPAASGLPESQELLPGKRELACTQWLCFQIYSAALWHLLCTQNSIFGTHLSPLPSSLPASTVQCPRHISGLSGSPIWSTVPRVQSPCAHLGATPSSRSELGWIHHRKGGEGKKRPMSQTWDLVKLLILSTSAVFSASKLFMAIYNYL